MEAEASEEPKESKEAAPKDSRAKSKSKEAKEGQASAAMEEAAGTKPDDQFIGRELSFSKAGTESIRKWMHTIATLTQCDMACESDRL